ncbi:MAG TPA: hypothetical protein VHE81_00635, partial [Lacipirellulaceae bacterium]|nr:hypothetical protein [Lacipirellulaceae bacterium]
MNKRLLRAFGMAIVATVAALMVGGGSCAFAQAVTVMQNGKPVTLNAEQLKHMQMAPGAQPA